MGWLGVAGWAQQKSFAAKTAKLDGSAKILPIGANAPIDQDLGVVDFVDFVEDLLGCVLQVGIEVEGDKIVEMVADTGTQGSDDRVFVLIVEDAHVVDVIDFASSPPEPRLDVGDPLVFQIEIVLTEHACFELLGVIVVTDADETADFHLIQDVVAVGHAEVAFGIGGGIEVDTAG